MQRRKGRPMTTGHRPRLSRIKLVIERTEDGYIAYPLGVKGVVVGQGDSYEEALADVRSAIAAHVREFGEETIRSEHPAIEAFLAETEVSLE